jgi:uncharacterized repeat protein (TIGR01451 family)
MNDQLTNAIRAGVLKFSCILILVALTGIVAVSAHPAPGRGSLQNGRSLPHFSRSVNPVCGVVMQDSVVGYIKSNTNNQVFYLLTVTNTGIARDSFSFSQLTSGTPLYSYVETVDGATLTRTPGIDPGGSYSFIIRFVVPNGSPAETTNYTNLVATSSICGSSSTDTSHLLTHLYSGKVSTGDSCDVQITKTASSGTVTAGDSLTYTISLINNLPGFANDVFVNDTLAAGLVYGSATVTRLPTGFNYSLSYNSTSHVVQFRALTALQQSQPITFTITVKAVCTAIPSVTNKVLVSSSTYDNKASNDTSSVTTNVTTAFSAPVASGITNCYNSTASLSASGAGSGAGYQWYAASSGGSLLYTGQNYTTPVLNTSTTYYVGYYDLDTTTCTGPRTPVTVNVTAAPGITGPSDITVCPAEPASFTVSTTGTSPSYQWQESTNGGSSWSNLVNSSVYSGVTSTSLTVTPTYSMNGYEYRCQVAANGCSNTIPGSAATLTVRKSYTWLGVNTNWDDPVNWCSGVPDSSSDVTIPSGLTYYPIITATASTHDIYTGSGTTVTLDSGTIRIFGTVTNNGLYDARTGTVNMKGSAAQTIAGSMFNSKTVLNLIDGNTSTAGLSVSSTAADTLKISGTLSFGTDSSKLNTGDNIDLLSTASATANVGVVSTNNVITGQVIVDRYINTGSTAGAHSGSWQFLATPTVGQSIRESWMENGSITHGYGTIITSPFGTSNAFDSYSVSSALKYFNATNNSWVGAASANNLLYNLNGYMIFVRGDRTVNSFYVSSNSTILRSKGTLLTGVVGPITVSPDHYQSVGNPYASIIDFTRIVKDAGVDDKFYTWDPYLFGTYGYGGYETISSINDWKPLPGGTGPYASGVADSTIQSGQAFFVYSTGTASFVQQTANLSFTESCKADGNKAINFTRNSARETSAGKSFLRASLFTGPAPMGRIADGNAVAFSTEFSNKVDRDDAVKILNGGENFGLIRDGKNLVIEARQAPTTADTIFYFISNVRQQKYQMRFTPENFQDLNIQPILLDSYLDTRTVLSVTDTTFVNVAFTSDPASRAIGRFKVVFRAPAPLPLHFVSLHTSVITGGVLLNWKVLNEDGVSYYNIQYSTDGTHFENIGMVAANPENNGNYNRTVSMPPTGNNYYRINSITTAGETSFSDVMKIYVPAGEQRISIAPNPAQKGVLQLCFSHEPAGSYLVRIINPNGQTIYSGQVSFAGGSGFIRIANSGLLNGIYQVELIEPGGSKKIMKAIY